VRRVITRLRIAVYTSVARRQKLSSSVMRGRIIDKNCGLCKPVLPARIFFKTCHVVLSAALFGTMFGAV
jgi:hypothetical protein